LTKHRPVRASVPASKLPIERACHDKVVYLSEIIARTEAQRAQAKYGGAELEPYHCSFCGFYHLTKKRIPDVVTDRV
jgi:hypothetical protein